MKDKIFYVQSRVQYKFERQKGVKLLFSILVAVLWIWETALKDSKQEGPSSTAEGETDEKRMG